MMHLINLYGPLSIHRMMIVLPLMTLMEFDVRYDGDCVVVHAIPSIQIDEMIYYQCYINMHVVEFRYECSNFANRYQVCTNDRRDSNDKLFEACKSVHELEK